MFHLKERIKKKQSREKNKKIKYQNQTHCSGMVSIFLLIILVPSIVVTSIFVDLARMNLSKSLATSSADLALNSLMANYDADLQEWYGMAASCQSIEEFYEGSAEYFLRSIESRDLTTEEKRMSVDYYANIVGDDTIYDLLQIEPQTETADIIQPVEGANLTNATIIKDQIVEFMKYRGPVEITSGLIHRFKQKTEESGLDNILESKANNEIVTQKKAYAEAEGEFLEKAYESYKAINAYDKKNVENDTLLHKAAQLKQYRDMYHTLHVFYMKYFSNTATLSKYTRPTGSGKVYTEKSPEVYSRYEIITPSPTPVVKKEKKSKSSKNKNDESQNETNTGNEEPIEVYYINQNKIDSLLTELENANTSFLGIKDIFTNAALSLNQITVGKNSKDADEIQWWVRASQVLTDSDTDYIKKFNRAADALLDANAKVSAMTGCKEEDDVTSDWRERYQDATKQSAETISEYLLSDEYLKFVNQLERISSDINKINPSNVEISMYGQTMTMGEWLVYIRKSMNETMDQLQEYINALDLAMNGNHKKVVSLEELKILADNYQKSFSKYEATVKNEETTYAKEENERINELELNEMIHEVTQENVQELKTRLQNIKSQVKQVYDAYDSLQYGDEKLKDIKTVKQFAKQFNKEVDVENIPLINEEIDSYSESTFQKLFHPMFSRLGDDITVLEHTDDNAYNPMIKVDEPCSPPKLYVYMTNRFKDVEADGIKKKQDEAKSVQDKMEKMKEDAKNGRYHGEGEDIVNSFSSGEEFGFDTVFKSLCTFIKNLFEPELDDIRDDIYVTTYAMEMFSYATYENEGLYHLVEDKTSLTINKVDKDGYKDVKGDEKATKEEGGKDPNQGKWLSTELTDTYNKSLTNKLINKQNNAAYEAELEYILFGEVKKGKTPTNNDNVKEAYETIFLMRYALNAVSGFQNFWSGSDGTTRVIGSIAKAIMAATQGIIPEALTKVVLIGILTGLETIKDLDRLERGFPVEFFKGKDDWWYSIDIGEVSESAGVQDFLCSFGDVNDKPNQDKGLFYSDYIMLFIYLGFSNKNGTISEGMYQRMAEVIQKNMQSNTGRSDYSLENSQVYFKLAATVRVRPLMITIPIVKGYMGDREIKEDWCTYKFSMIRGY